MAITFRNKVGGWELVSDAIKARQAELPDLAEAQAELESLIAQAKSLSVQQQEQFADLKRTVRMRREMETRGEDLRQRLFGALRFRLGFTDEALHIFGMKPRKKRRKTEETPAPQPASPAPTSGDPAA
jgi:hypothetical protein